MKIYLAGSGWNKIWEKMNFFTFNRLETFWGINAKKEGPKVKLYDNYMLDSGAFSMFGSKEKTDLDAYVTNMINFINEYDVKQFFELDIYALIGKEKTDIINKRIEKETGKQTIPVFHFFLGTDEYKRMCEEYEYISISASGFYAAKWTRKEPEKLRKLIDYAHSKNVRVHGLGYTALNMLDKMPFDSVDSTAWLSGNRFGMVYEWLGDKFKKHPKKEGQRVYTDKTAKHNFHEWVKFSNFANKNY